MFAFLNAAEHCCLVEVVCVKLSIITLFAEQYVRNNCCVFKARSVFLHIWQFTSVLHLMCSMALFHVVVPHSFLVDFLVILCSMIRKLVSFPHLFHITY